MSGAPKLKPVDLRSVVSGLLSGRKTRLMAGSRAEKISALVLSERELVDLAMKVTELPIAGYLRRALIAMARRDLAHESVRKGLVRNEGMRGVLHSADARIEAAYKLLQAQRAPITPARLKYRAKASFATCKLWMERKGLLA